MSKLGKLWTDSVAYVALIIGAGLSIAGNVADTYRTRGIATDTLDIVLAVAWPALVVLMVELFVSRRWDGRGRAMQAIRWIGTIGIGSMAMRVSWVHLNDLLLSRGQASDVALIGPLAIDSLAIMATALILSGRVSRPVVLDIPAVATPAPAVATPVVQDIEWTSTDQNMFDRLATELSGETTPAVPLAIHSTTPAAVGHLENVPDEARNVLDAWDRTALKCGQIDALVADRCRVTVRTARRWRSIVHSS